MHFKPWLKPERFEDISEDPPPTSVYTLGYVNRNPGTGTVTHPPPTNIPQSVVTDIENISKEIQKYMNRQPSTGSNGADKTKRQY